MAISTAEPGEALLLVWNLLGWAHLSPALLVGTSSAMSVDTFVSASYQTLRLCYRDNLPEISEGWVKLASRQLDLEGLGQWTDSPSGCLKRKYGSNGLCQRLMYLHEQVVASILGVTLTSVETLAGPFTSGLLASLEEIVDRCMLDSYHWQGEVWLVQRLYSGCLPPTALTKALQKRNREVLLVCANREPVRRLVILPDEV